ncbi:MAG TPA: DNA gyrase inhibitor YacG [Sphingobium sp.]
MPVKKQCPLCRKTPNPEFAPFCSKGCRDRDLLAWLGEEYRTPGPPAEQVDDEGRIRPLSHDEE